MKTLTPNNRNPFILVRGAKHIGASDMAYMTFETRESYEDFKKTMDEAMWGIFIKDAPDGGYWELVYYTKFLSRFLDMKSEDILSVLDRPHKWADEYTIYKKFQKLTDGETDSYTLHTMDILNFEDLEKAMNEPDFAEKYFEALTRWS
ncbi:MAG: hypothetical protein HOG73_05260 [Candidatus Marinimicrobia bacterium]|mgnify:FL=1|jgi:hypothetical protein|nr:hypothetical protein [Candidatus Neomarinimicrobiota bacterium]